MALRLIRRHLKDCPHTSTKYRRCRCPIHVYGTLAGERIRKALDQTSWDAASELIMAWTAAGEIGAVKVEAPAIREAVRKYLADCEPVGLGFAVRPRPGAGQARGSGTPTAHCSDPPGLLCVYPER